MRTALERALSLADSYLASGCQLTLLHQSRLQERLEAETHFLSSKPGMSGAPWPSHLLEGGEARCTSTPHQFALPPPVAALHPSGVASPGRAIFLEAGISQRASQRAFCRGAHCSWLCRTVSYCSLLSSAAGGGILGCSFLQSEAR